MLDAVYFSITSLATVGTPILFCCVRAPLTGPAGPTLPRCDPTPPPRGRNSGGRLPAKLKSVFLVLFLVVLVLYSLLPLIFHFQFSHTFSPTFPLYPPRHPSTE